MALSALFTVLMTMAKIMSPATPFITELMYQVPVFCCRSWPSWRSLGPWRPWRPSFLCLLLLSCSCSCFLLLFLLLLWTVLHDDGPNHLGLCRNAAMNPRTCGRWPDRKTSSSRSTC